MQKLTDVSIQAARQWFAKNCMACAEAARQSLVSGQFYCNDPESYIIKKEQEAENWLNGDIKMTFTFWQRAYFIQTGESVAFLPK